MKRNRQQGGDIMFDPSDTEMFWLNVTNISLGLVTLVCIAAVVAVTVRELAMRRSRVRIPVSSDDHAFALADLGITMADGGEKVDERTILGQRDSHEDNDQSNICRSNN
jgi:hypothetical protein